MSQRRVGLLLHEDLIPPENVVIKGQERDDCPWITEHDVLHALKKLKHHVQIIGVSSDLKILRRSIEEFKPHVIFNLLEEFDGEAIFDQNVVAYLEMLRVPYTGCNSRGLVLARDKALAKKILTYHRLPTPRFFVCHKKRPIKINKLMKYPMIVKCLTEEASYGISKASIVHNYEKLCDRVEYVHEKLNDHAIIEEFIEGREVFVGVMGNYRVQTLPVWQLMYQNVEAPQKELYSTRAKFNPGYRKRKGIVTQRAELELELEKKIQRLCKKAYRVLNLSGYARMDLRIDNEGKVYFIEANPNPDIASEDEFALSAKYQEITYQKLIQKLLNLGISWEQGK